MSGVRHPRSAGPRNMAFGAIVAASSAALVVGYLRLPVRMESVTVSGLTRLSREEVVRMIGMKPGTMMESADARRLGQNLARRPAFAAVAVSRGLTGILHLKVVEREPVAWSVHAGCAVAADGILLPHLSRRSDAWIALDGLTIAAGRIMDSSAVAEALAIRRDLFAAGSDLHGVIRKVGAGHWEWHTGEKRITLSSPPQSEELVRLTRFQRSFPDAWARARMLDLRFAERVVVSAGPPARAGRRIR